MDATTAIFETVKVLTGVAAVGVAGLGLKTWRRQLHGTVEFDRARGLYRAVLSIRNQIAGVRNPFISAGEFASAYQEVGLEPTTGSIGHDAKGSELVYERRWKRLVVAMTDLEVELLDAEVLWGSGIREPERLLRGCTAELYSAVVNHLRSERDSRYEEKLAEPLRDKLNRALYDEGTAERPDDFASRVNAAIAAFEKSLRPHLSGRKLTRPT